MRCSDRGRDGRSSRSRLQRPLARRDAAAATRAAAAAAAAAQDGGDDGSGRRRSRGRQERVLLQRRLQVREPVRFRLNP